LTVYGLTELRRNRCRDVLRLEGAGTSHPFVCLWQGEHLPGLAGVDGLHIRGAFGRSDRGRHRRGGDDARSADPVPFDAGRASSATATARTRILAGRVDAATWAFRDHGVVAYGPRQSGADRLDGRCPVVGLTEPYGGTGPIGPSQRGPSRNNLGLARMTSGQAAIAEAIVLWS
jgi:hypothetical protein